MADNEKNVCIQKINFGFILFRENDIFTCFSKMHDFELKKKLPVRF